MDRLSMIDNEQAAERKDWTLNKGWILPWLVFPVLGSGLLGLVLAMLSAAI